MAAALAEVFESLRLKPPQLQLAKLNASTCMAALEADTAFVGHFTPRLALEPFRHRGGTGIEFAVFPLGEVDSVRVSGNNGSSQAEAEKMTEEERRIAREMERAKKCQPATPNESPQTSNP